MEQFVHSMKNRTLMLDESLGSFLEVRSIIRTRAGRPVPASVKRWWRGAYSVLILYWCTIPPMAWYPGMRAFFGHVIWNLNKHQQNKHFVDYIIPRVSTCFVSN